MSPAVRRRFAIAGVALLHLVATVLFSFWVLGFILQRHHYGLSPQMERQGEVVKAVSQLLEFPLMPLSRAVLRPGAIGVTPLTWLANSVLWAFVLYALAALVASHVRRKPSVQREAARR